MPAPKQIFVSALLCLAVLLPGCGGGSDDNSSPAPSSITGSLPLQADLLFVLRGPAMTSDGRITVDTDAVEWFTDRPKRRAGVADANELIKYWKDYGFTQDPPNAALSGDETDAVVVLTKPELSSDGISFAFKSIRGEVKDSEQMSVFVDGSEWKTDMHVYVKVVKGNNGQSNLVGWCNQSDQTVLENPEINSAPANWSYYPTDSITLTGSNQEIFTAASKSGNTSFTVTYEVMCQDGNNLTPVGQLKLSGKVPDNLNPDEFGCNPLNVVTSSNSSGLRCEGSEGGGYHVDAYVVLDWNESSVNDQITD